MAKNRKRQWLSRIENSPKSFNAVPEELKSFEFCLAAVKQNGRMLEYVPDSLKTEAMCLVAFNETARALKYVPENLKVKLSPIFTIRLTNDEINIINIWAKSLCASNENEVLEINEIIRKEGKEYMIDSFTQYKLINIICITDPFHNILSIKLSEKNTKAILSCSNVRGPLCGGGFDTFFLKKKMYGSKLGDHIG